MVKQKQKRTTKKNMRGELKIESSLNNRVRLDQEVHEFFFTKLLKKNLIFFQLFRFFYQKKFFFNENLWILYELLCSACKNFCIVI